MMGTSLHTLVQMVDNGLGADLRARHGDRDRNPRRHRRSRRGGFSPTTDSAGSRSIWRRSSPRENEFQLLAATLRRIARDLIPDLEPVLRAAELETPAA